MASHSRAQRYHISVHHAVIPYAFFHIIELTCVFSQEKYVQLNSSDQEQSGHGLSVCFIYQLKLHLITMKDLSLLSIGITILKLDT